MIAAIVSTLADTHGSPESTLYIFCGMDMEIWQQIRHVLVEGGLVNIRNHYVTLTPLGVETAEKLNEVLNKRTQVTK